ncbi:hypothetical protein [Flavobacterium pectinovorum]|uniref:hypothetical protein n=1 Tax=Flavobacterium pectinovorum TaxID=29533 RepID=UPI001FACA92E|nr:hypothetical protein [Flavobacterium pectinovorum]MCI9846917.1 hypothetical protein [Flavobacterium pectinovorum]
MKKKPLSESSLEELLKNKKIIQVTIISFGILFAISSIIMIAISKYTLLFTFLPIVLGVGVAVYSGVSEINSEIKKRNS